MNMGNKRKGDTLRAAKGFPGLGGGILNKASLVERLKV
jgi:hypothetical protein